MEVQQNTALPPEYAGLTFEKVWAMFQETDKQIKETDKQIKETTKLLHNNQKMMSDLGRKFGTVIEHMFIPNLREKFNAFGYYFEKSSPNVLIGNREHNIYAEIDVFLENGNCALAVEVKTQANINDIREHVERMGKLRRYFDLHNDKRKLYGAVAAAIIPDNVRDFALKQGFYVVEQSGDNVAVKKPEGSPRAW
jgi:predicted AAA+ superfamily ATPase